MDFSTLVTQFLQILYINILPRQYSIKNTRREIYDQGNLNSCTANAICSLFETYYPDKKFSRLFLYTMMLKLKKTCCNLNREGEKILETYGICEERFFPYVYDEEKVTIPYKDAFENAMKYKIKVDGVKDITDQGLVGIKANLYINKPVLIGFAISDSFRKITPENDIIKYSDDEVYAQNHQALIVAYDEEYLTIQNSYGIHWGKQGLFRMPYAYLDSTYNGQKLVSQLLVIDKSDILYP